MDNSKARTTENTDSTVDDYSQFTVDDPITVSSLMLNELIAHGKFQNYTPGTVFTGQIRPGFLPYTDFVRPFEHIARRCLHTRPKSDNFGPYIITDLVTDTGVVADADVVPGKITFKHAILYLDGTQPLAFLDDPNTLTDLKEFPLIGKQHWQIKSYVNISTPFWPCNNAQTFTDYAPNKSACAHPYTFDTGFVQIDVRPPFSSPNSTSVWTGSLSWIMWLDMKQFELFDYIEANQPYSASDLFWRKHDPFVLKEFFTIKSTTTPI